MRHFHYLIVHSEAAWLVPRILCKLLDTLPLQLLKARAQLLVLLLRGSAVVPPDEKVLPGMCAGGPAVLQAEQSPEPTRALFCAQRIVTFPIISVVIIISHAHVVGTLRRFCRH